MFTNTVGGGVDPTAVIGHAPEHRDWTPGCETFAPAIHSFARIEAFVTVDSGMSRPTMVGADSWLMKHSHVGHDALIGANVEVSPGAVIGGYAEVMSGTHIGMNATILPYRKIGKNCVIGAGAVVTKDVPDGWTVVGNPARRLFDAQRDPRPHTERKDHYPGSGPWTEAHRHRMLGHR